MAIRDTNGHAGVALAGGPEELWPVSGSEAAEPPDWRSLYEREFVARHHYLGYKTLVGAQMRYAVHDRNGWPLAMLGFSTAAWALAPRDRFIGWTPTLRRKNPAAGRRQPPVPHPALDPHPQPRIPHPRARPPPPAPRLDPPLQHHPRPRRDLRRGPPLHRRRLQGLRLDPRRHHQGTRALRHRQAVRQAHQGCLAPPARQALEAHPQPLSPALPRPARQNTSPRPDRTVT